MFQKSSCIYCFIAPCVQFMQLNPFTIILYIKIKLYVNYREKKCFHFFFIFII